jgi:transcriptional regulator of arginine metabolism
MASKDSLNRVALLRRLLTQGKMTTQEDLVGELLRQKFHVTQSTVSRDLRRLGAVKVSDPSGRIVYRLPDDLMISAPVPTSNLRNLIQEIEHNGALIVIRTTPGSASLVARHLDNTKPNGILGTIAGDDTIFVAPATMKQIAKTVEAILEELS